MRFFLLLIQKNRIAAMKLGAHKVILTDGDTDTLDNMRDNIETNIENSKDSILCRQLRWGHNVEGFVEKWCPETGFDVVMVGSYFVH
jgi:predicted nicotinamide N-methyase